MWRTLFTKVRTFSTKANLVTVYGKMGGRSWLLISFFAGTAFYLELHGKLTSDYAGTISALSAFHITRAIMSDRHDENMSGQKE